MRALLLSLACVALSVGVSRADEWDKSVDAGIAYLKSTQNADGSWGPAPRNRGVTGLIVTALLKTGKVTTDDPMVAKGLKFVESLINEKAGHIAGQDAAVGLQNYVTSINVLALQTANKPEKYKAVVEALKEAGVPSDDPALKKALVFVSRCQNLKSEFNDRPWAGKINDGSFIYSAAAGGQTKTSDDPKAPLTGYGSMTYAGIKSMIYCGVSKDDPRYAKAYEWITKNYTLEINPGMPAELGGRGLYYYYHTMAKTLDAMGVAAVTDAAGKKHDWKAELTAELAKRQKADGSWINPTDRWMEGDGPLVTGYALMTLAHSKPKK